MSSIIPLSDVEPALIEELLDAAFGSDRHQRTAYRAREGTDWLEGLSFAALDENGELAGTIQCWPVALTEAGRRNFPLIMVGPVAVLPHCQGQGYGKAMMLAMIQSVDPRSPLPLMMIGDPEYYGRFFGFTADHTGGWQMPGPFEQHRLLCRCDNPALLPREGMIGPWLNPAARAAG